MRLLCVYSLMASVAGSVAADADFMSVRTQLAKDWSGKGGDPGDKYFRECLFSLFLPCPRLTCAF
jgi:hypothetical protein